jgi:surfeit locus 1 family protein
MTFRPPLSATALLAALAMTFAGLGGWQLQRAGQKQATVEKFESAQHITDLGHPAADYRFARLTLTGAFDQERHILVDNRIHRGRAGVHVLTAVRSVAGTSVLVNRGWLPIPPDRRSLPPVHTAAGLQEISGMLDRLQPPGRKLGESDRLATDSWPQLVTYPDLDDISAALGVELYPLILLLDPQSPGGFADRDWQPVFMTPERHRGYAVQWLALAATALALWVFLGIHRGRRMEQG